MFYIGVNKPYVTDTLKTNISQAEAIKIIKEKAKEAGYTYRTRKMKDGSLRVILQRRGFKTDRNVVVNIGSCRKGLTKTRSRGKKP